MDAMGNGLSFMAAINGGDPNHSRLVLGWSSVQERTVQLHQVQGHVSVEDTDCPGNRTLGRRSILRKKKRKKREGLKGISGEKAYDYGDLYFT